MLVKGSILSEFSGKLGGVVGGHNRGGQYLRQFRVPTNPNSTLQQRARLDFGQIAIAWRETLTQAQRAAWDAIAPTITAVNRLGDTIELNGQQAYQRAAVAAALAGLPAPAAAPSGTGETPLGDVTVDELLSPDTVTIAVSGSPPWAANDDGRLLVFVGDSVSQATNFYRGPYQFAGAAPGNTATPVTTPTITIPAANRQMVENLRVFIRMYAYLNGRVSQVVTLPQTVTP